MSVLVNKQAPDFTATAVVNGSEFVKLVLTTKKKKYYYSLPLDFTFVCPTEHMLSKQN